MSQIKLTFSLLILTQLLVAQAIVFGGAVTGGLSIEITDPPPAESIGAEWYVGPDPIGGGPGFSQIFTQNDFSDNRTSSWVITGDGNPAESLKTALGAAGSNDSVFVCGGVEIDLTNEALIWIQDNVLLCGNRGQILNDTVCWGALIYENTIESSVEMFRCRDTVKIMGLRFRGYWNWIDGTISPDDSVSDDSPSDYYCLLIADNDSLEVANCEFYGFSGSSLYGSNTQGLWFHHNMTDPFTSCIYKSYPINLQGATSYRITGNLCHKGVLFMGGGSGSAAMHGVCDYNFTTWQSPLGWDWHGGLDDSISVDTMYNNTLTNVLGGCTSYNRDSSYVYDNWFFFDSASTWANLGNPKVKRPDNYYGTSPPEGISSRKPTAVIVASADTGNVPLTVKFTATGSSDPDGSLRTFYWFFGDSSGSDNSARVRTHDDTVSHTYGEVGLYTVTLMVQDSLGIPNWTFKHILVQPTDGKKYFSAWVTDYNHEKTDPYAGWFKKQIWLDGWKIWEADVTGANDYEHVVVEVTDTLAIKDSITIEVRLACEKDTTSGYGVTMYVDNIHIDGVEVLGGDFEGQTWSGNYYSRDSEYWDGGYSGNYMRCYETTRYSFWDFCYSLYKTQSTAHANGDYSYVKQKANVE